MPTKLYPEGRSPQGERGLKYEGTGKLHLSEKVALRKESVD